MAKTLDITILHSGIFSSDPIRSLRTEFQPFNEYLTARYLAEEINEGTIDPISAYTDLMSDDAFQSAWPAWITTMRWRTMKPHLIRPTLYAGSMIHQHQAKRLVDYATFPFRLLTWKIEEGYYQDSYDSKYLPSNDFALFSEFEFWCHFSNGSPYAEELLKDLCKLPWYQFVDYSKRPPQPRINDAWEIEFGKMLNGF